MKIWVVQVRKAYQLTQQAHEFLIRIRQSVGVCV